MNRSAPSTHTHQQSDHLRTLDALMMAAPVATATRFDQMDRCIECSLAAVTALRKRGFVARAIPIGLTARRGDSGVGIGIKVPKGMPFTDPRASGDGPNLHMIVDAQAAGDRWIIDLTIGQLRRFGVDVPLVYRTPAPSILQGCGFDTDEGWAVTYTRTPHTVSQVAKWARRGLPPEHDISEELNDTIDMVLSVDVSHAAFEAHMRKSDPDRWDRVMNRLTAWNDLTQTPEW